MKYILQLNEAGLEDVLHVGGKNASLGEMLQHLDQLGIQVPGGFILTVDAYHQFMSYNKLNELVLETLAKTDTQDIKQLQQCGRLIRGLIREGNFPDEMRRQIAEAYAALSRKFEVQAVDVAVRSSATAEDLPDASFAGQQDTYLNVRGVDELLTAIRHCFASLFTDRAISYRESFGYPHFQVGLSVCVQKMVRADLGAAGVAFSLDTESGFRDVVVINGSWGLGELLVQGAIKPDEFTVFKPLLNGQGFRPLIEKKLGDKREKMVYSAKTRVETVQTTVAERQSFCLEEDTALKLAAWVAAIEQYYSNKHGKWCPVDVEWAIDGETGQLYVVQARPETVHSRRSRDTISVYKLNDADEGKEMLLQGIAVGDGIASGQVRLLGMEASGMPDITDFRDGDVLVTDMTDPDWEPLMKKAAAIITNKGGRTCHAAIVARELGVPAIVGCGNATAILNEGQLVTVCCGEGEQGHVYYGKLNYTREEHQLDSLPETTTAIMMNVASPDVAFKLAAYPHCGVGLAREEFIINNYIGIHPQALLEYRRLNDAALTEKIETAISGYPNGETFFVERLAHGISRIAAAFYPQKVIVRFSDFKTNEYAHMPGGQYFEPGEENPMIGWRGASRYYSDAYRQAFGMECRAIRKVREEIGLDNVAVMIPFCRTVGELVLVQDIMREHGLERGKAGLRLYLMAEVPSNVILARQFARYIDGFSIGSNDLTQLVLGLDRDSALVANLYNERNEAVKDMIAQLIRIAKDCRVTVGICGQGPSDYPDFAEFLVSEGIDSISVTPDAFLKTVKAVHGIEQQMTEASQIA